MMMALKKIIPIFLVFALFQVFSVEGVYAQKVATLDNVKGNVNVVKEGKTRGRKGREGMALFSRQTIQTLGPDALADVVYINGDRIRIMPNSELKLAKADLSEGKGNIGIDLGAGKIFNVVNKLTAGSTYTVTTRTAIAGVKGTTFSVESSGNESVFMVKEGTVEAVNPSVSPQGVLVSDLKKTIVQAQQAPTEPIPLTLEEIAMFDILDDLFEDDKQDIRDEIKEQIQEDIIESLDD
jgi:hypothetical protein